MALATANSRILCRPIGVPFWLCLLSGALPCLAIGGAPSAPEEFRANAQTQFQQAQASYSKNPSDPQLAWQFGRACFDLAEYSTNRAERAEIAQQGLAACRQGLIRASNSAAPHYYLGMNLGQLARTKTLG